ncbi:uncharacterized protein LOC114929111 isoform X3 [Nylanderia fulva]|uniref:uncharacterized protein LOC114929111 isoform X3 n=1 Tax=Nylanderia fulva TaxID=613905 RepID=UPI0010FAFCE1|nr:uncharacterized protein LOC114929111 isoform X3 [Nylanderia fulva]
MSDHRSHLFASQESQHAYFPSSYFLNKVVVPKRAALLLDQLMVALQKVVDNQGKSTVGESRGMSRGMSRGTKVSAPRFIANTEIADDQTVVNSMDLQRRGQAKGQVYWRCYFNAVTCFKRK